MRKGITAGGASIVLVAVLVVYGASVTAQEAASKLVSAEWLQGKLEDNTVRIIDVRADVRDYWQGHIPGAVYFSPDALRLSDGGVPVKLVPPDVLALMLGKMGVTQRTTVIAYAEGNDFKAPYLIWALDYIGHPASAMLDGGFTKWKKAGLPVTQDYPKIGPQDYRLPAELHEEVRARLDEVKKVVNRGGAVLLDVRPLELYTGEKGFWKRNGHIKGALHHFWGDNLDESGNWKSVAALTRDYQRQGVTGAAPVIVSCGQGQMSVHSYFALKYILGYTNVKNYDGSFNEWSNIDELPVETGK